MMCSCWLCWIGFKRWKDRSLSCLLLLSSFKKKKKLMVIEADSSYAVDRAAGFCRLHGDWWVIHKLHDLHLCLTSIFCSLSWRSKWWTRCSRKRWYYMVFYQLQERNTLATSMPKLVSPSLVIFLPLCSHNYCTISFLFFSKISVTFQGENRLRH